MKGMSKLLELALNIINIQVHKNHSFDVLIKIRNEFV